MPKVIVLPQNVSAEVDSGELLLHAGEKAGVEMEAGCFSCFCGTCVVEIITGTDHLEEPTPQELEILDGWNKDAQRYRLACCTRITHGEVVIRISH